MYYPTKPQDQGTRFVTTSQVESIIDLSFESCSLGRALQVQVGTIGYEYKYRGGHELIT